MIQVFLTKFKSTLNKTLTGRKWEDFADDGYDLTGSLLGPWKKALDVIPRQFYDLSGSNQTVSAYNSNNQVLTAVGAFTNARRGDMVVFNSGASKDLEFQILKRLTDDEALVVYTDASITVSDTFRVYRSKVAVVDSSGNAQSTTTPASKAPVNTVALALSGVTTGAYTQLFSTIGTTAAKQIQVFMSSGTPLYLAFGGVGSETDKFIILPGGRDVFEIDVPAGTRLSVKAVSAPDEAFTTEQLIVNLFG